MVGVGVVIVKGGDPAVAGVGVAGSAVPPAFVVALANVGLAVALSKVGSTCNPAVDCGDASCTV